VVPDEISAWKPEIAPHAIVIKQNGKIFHYIGDPESKSGARTTAGVIRRLQEAGFKRVSRAPRAFGVVAYKE